MSRPLPRPHPALLALLAVLLVLAPVRAWAHDELIGSEPEAGAVLEEAPDAVVLTFSGAIADLGAQVALEDGSGRSLTDGAPRVDGPELEQDLVDLGAGDYTVLWRVTSADGHPISGKLAFTVAGDGDDEPSPTSVAAGGDGTDEPTGDPATAAAAADPTTDPDLVRDRVEGGTGLPVWVWVVVGAAVLALLALLVRTWTRGRA